MNLIMSCLSWHVHTLVSISEAEERNEKSVQWTIIDCWEIEKTSYTVFRFLTRNARSVQL